ncbi:unnamed protein product [Nippostrongylus brasiliensis]|uniref:Molybdate-anion transporter n=1 Tax=Nippostrongylus brasiliensis TaxID=27835 RepID=A0A158R1R5_NIPBR|nr:unnamed protein product [Nippostrongylus brasiliensis]
MGGGTRRDLVELGTQLARMHKYNEDRLRDSSRSGSFVGSSESGDSYKDGVKRFGFHTKGNRDILSVWPELERKATSLLATCSDVVPALVHGDLWGGNWSSSSEGPAHFVIRNLNKESWTCSVATEKISGRRITKFYPRGRIGRNGSYCTSCTILSITAGVLLMFDVHLVAWIWCGVCSVTSVAVANSQRKNRPRDVAENNAEFRGLQRRFLFPYLIVLFAESLQRWLLQAPYLYAFFYDLSYLPTQIAVLYVTGLISNMVFSFYCVHLLARYGRRALCLLCIAAGCLACACKLKPSFAVLFIGRILDGLFAALISSPFQQYVDEHQMAFDFPPEWIQSTFLILSLGAGFLAVTAGVTSHIVVGISKVIVIPYILSIVALLVMRSNPMAFVISVTSCCAEMAFQMFVFAWAPLFIRAEHSGMKSVYALGVIYASFVASYLAGLLLFSSLSKRMRNSRLLLLSLTVAFLIFVVA